MELLEFFAGNQSKLLEQTLEHIGLTFISLLLAVVIAIPAGIFITRRPRFSGSILGFVSVLQTIPSIALLGFLIPLLGIGMKPAIFALFLYALLPILRNTFTGIREVDPAVREAAVGMGMTPGQVLRKVELPLALPVIFAGIRTATVINVGIATLAAYIGAGGLGEFIFGGIALNNANMILAGAIPAALMAILFDQGLAVLQRLQTRRLAQNAGYLALGLPLLAAAYFLPQTYGPELRAGFDTEFIGRPDGYDKLKAVYGVRFNTIIISSALMYKAVDSDQVDVIGGYSTDGRIKAYDLATLRDDRHAFPPYYAAPLVRRDLFIRHPGLDSVLNLLAGRIDDATMTELNYKVDHEKRSPEAVARTFLDSMGLWYPDRRQGGDVLTIGSKIFTEQYLLTELYAQLINGHTDFDTDAKPGLGGTKICFDALRNDGIDLYIEYTGTGLQVLLTPADSTLQRIITDPPAVYDYVQQQFQERYDLQWLQPLGFNNTYALMMKRKQMEKKGWTKVSDLVD